MRSLTHRFLALALASLSTGCLSQSHALEITGFYGPDTTQCLGDFAITLGAGLVATDVPGAFYNGSLSVENTLTTNQSTADHRTNSLDITLDSIDVTYLPIPATGAAPSPNKATLGVYGFVRAGGVLNWSNVPIVPASVVAAAGSLEGVVARLSVRGRLTDGTRVATPEVDYPVMFCTNCMTIPTCFVKNDPANPDDPNNPTDDPLVEADDVDGPNQSEQACGLGGTGQPYYMTCPI